MAHSHAKLDVEHRCIAAKCKGRLADPPESYGRYAYWRRGRHNKWGWYATPSNADEDDHSKLEQDVLELLRRHYRPRVSSDDVLEASGDVVLAIVKLLGPVETK